LKKCEKVYNLIMCCTSLSQTLKLSLVKHQVYAQLIFANLMRCQKYWTQHSI